ncbi:MAG TPA: carboxypeptidase-like regulatory domain-containing protein [Gemmatimonadaceae bacterium]|nr:carboxypeptidase-like regulatory domain-containing protein [Gemmatimonadaceae bacterium]
MQQRFSAILLALAATGCATHTPPQVASPPMGIMHVVAAIPVFDAGSATRDSTTPAIMYALVGTVVDADSGQPLVSSEILVRRASDGKIMQALTNSRGGFIMPRIPPGQYGLIVRRIGYVPLTDLRDGQAGVVDTLRLKMWPSQASPKIAPNRSSAP